MLYVLKYVSWGLSVGTPFVGGWFFEFTTTNKETGRRSLTRWGRRGILFAAVALVCALALQILTDLEAARKSKEARLRADAELQRAEAERAAASNWRTKFDKSQGDIYELVTILADADENVRSSARKAIDNLSTIDEFREKYPDLYQRLQGAPSFEQVKDVLSEGLSRSVSERISTDPECDDIPLKYWEDSIFPTTSFFLTADKKVSLSLMVTSDGVNISLSDYGPQANLKGGYRVILEDNSYSDEITCSMFNSKNSCNTISTSELSAYSDFQNKRWHRIETAGGSIDVEPTAATSLLHTLACISP